jgi:Uma2 family endonuclease
MSGVTVEAPIRPFVLRLGPMLKRISDHEFFEFCQRNPELRIERTQDGEILVMPPTGSETGGRNFNLAVEFGIWLKSNGAGKGFDSSTGFTLPNGAKRSPDLSWIRLDRWNALTDAEKREFAPICPDFVVELRSPSDALEALSEKMREYMANGARLGWLIDPTERKVYVYRPHTDVEILDHPLQVAGDPVLPGFVLDTEPIWGE